MQNAADLFTSSGLCLVVNLEVTEKHSDTQA